MPSDGSSPYELLYSVQKQGHQNNLSNGSLIALDLISAFDIQRSPIGDSKEWHILTFNQIRILEEINKIRRGLLIPQSQSPYEILYEVQKQGYQANLSNGSLAALDQVLAFDILRSPMGDSKEWHTSTFNQIRILEELNEIKKVVHIILISLNDSPTSESQNFYESFYPLEKQGHQNYLGNGSLSALDQVLAFDIQKPMGESKEWHMLTFNQIRIIEELDKFTNTLRMITSPRDPTTLSQPQTLYEFNYQMVKQGHQNYLSNGSLFALDHVLAFDIKRVMGDAKEWRIATFNQIRIFEKLNRIQKILPVFRATLGNIIKNNKSVPVVAE